MRRALIVAALVAFAAGGAAAYAQQTVFRGTSDVVRVFATVADRDGRLVTSLTREQFEIRDEGKPQPITQFDIAPQPIRLVVLLDVSGSMAGNLPLLLGASRQLLARLRPDDLAMVGSFGREVTLSGMFSKNTTELMAALPREIPPDAPTPLWHAIEKGLSAFDGTGETRRAILVLSDGKDSGMINFREKPASQAEVIDHARRDNVMIYGVGMRSRRIQSTSPGIGPGGLQAALLAEMPDPGLARVAEETGGGYLEIRPGDDLGEAFAAVADELHTQYMLGFAPPKRDGKVHDISVKVSVGGMKARARKNYLAAKE